MIPQLIHIGDSFTPQISLMMRETLERGEPYNGGLEESMKYFGKHFEAACALSAPVAVAIDGMLPGFKEWLETTKFSEDKMMIATLLEIANYLARYRRPSDARMRPDTVPLPRFH